MRILLGTNHFFADIRGGGDRVAWEAAKYLAAHGHDVAILCEGIENSPECERVEGVLVLRYQISPFNFNFLTRHQDAGTRVLKKHLSQWMPNLLWGHMPLQTVAMMNAFPGVRLSYTVHSPVALEILFSKTFVDPSLKIKSFLGNRIEQQCCNEASVITVLSEYTKSEIARAHGTRVADRVRITPGWANLQRIKPISDRKSAKLKLGWPIDSPVFFSLRRLVPRMGLDRLVSAAALVRERGLKFRLKIGGTGPLHQELAKQIENLHIGESVELLGAVPEDQLALMYGAADAFVIPTRALECFGLIAVEAMGAGTPVLSTPVGALPEMIAQIEPCWLARDNSAEAIAEIMCDFIEGRLPIHDAAEIRSFVESNYDESFALERYVQTAIAGADTHSKELAHAGSTA